MFGHKTNWKQSNGKTTSLTDETDVILPLFALYTSVFSILN